MCAGNEPTERAEGSIKSRKPHQKCRDILQRIVDVHFPKSPSPSPGASGGADNAIDLQTDGEEDTEEEEDVDFEDELEY